MGSLILIDRIEVQNANSISSPLTIGVPSITAFMGFAHQIQRLVHQADTASDFKIDRVGVIVHDIDLQTRAYMGSRTRLKLTGNPLTQQGKRPSFIEEGRCHMTVSLLLDCTTDFAGGQRPLLDQVQRLVIGRMRLAGGEIVNTHQPAVDIVADDRRTLCRLIPGWVLMERRDLMLDAMSEGLDAIDAMHRALAIHHQRPTASQDPDSETPIVASKSGKWPATRFQSGYVVPIATGYQALTPVTPSNNARDRETPHRLAESVLTLGEFVLPVRLDRPSDMLWQYQHHGDLYVCEQTQPNDSKVPPSSPLGDS